MKNQKSRAMMEGVMLEEVEDCNATYEGIGYLYFHVVVLRALVHLGLILKLQMWKGNSTLQLQNPSKEFEKPSKAECIIMAD